MVHPTSPPPAFGFPRPDDPRLREHPVSPDSMSAEIISLTAAEAIERLRAGELSQEELFEAYRERIERVDPQVGSFLWTASSAPDGVRTDAPLAGVPIAIKDIFCTQDVPTTAGSRILEGYRPPYNATAVRRLEQGGTAMLGKTNMDEFAMGSSNENSGYGPARNPWDRERVPGGSSGGSAAAVAAGLAPWAIGTDTGGSIRQPASLCGIVGLRPTYGSVSRYGMVAFASSLDQCGPITRSVTDAALLLAQLVGRDPCDSTSVDPPEPITLPGREDLQGIRFGVPAELSFEAEGVEPGVAEVFERTLALIQELGGTVEETKLPHAAHGIAAYYVLASAEASANLARYDGVRFGLRAGDGDLLDLYETTRANGFGPEVKRRIMLGTFALSSGYYEAYYGRAQRVRTKIAGDFAAAFERFDFLVTPTSPSVAFKLGERTQDPLAMYLSDYCTVPMPLAGIPAISIPAGLAPAPEESAGAARGNDSDARGLPVGLQIVGPAFSENGMLEAAFALEQAIGFDARPEVFDE
jgi:aspartyl-tRNA(Asn)/glutamyl-tRNA(Gln) amidotransferase subunit A